MDHIDGNGLNCCKSNLRICTQSQNNANSRTKKLKGFKGTIRGKGDRKWYAMITKDYVRYHLGGFQTEEEAARAYDAAAKKLFGEFARLNFPEVK